MKKTATRNAAGILWVLCTPAFAQHLAAASVLKDGDNKAGADVAATDEGQESGGRSLEEVTVTARKREENAQNVPISVAVLGEEQLSKAQVNLVTDLPAETPSLNYARRGVTTSNTFAIRGVGAFTSGPGIQAGVGLAIDGVPILRSVEFDMELNDVQNVQVLSGPQGTLFGANTIGGVINVTTKQPTRTFEGYSEAVATTDEEFILRAGVSGPMSDRIRGRISAYGKNRRGYEDNIYPGMAPAGGERAHGVNGQLDIDVTDTVDLKLRADYRRQVTTDNTHTTVAVPGAAGYLSVLGNGNPAFGQFLVDDPGKINSDFPQEIVVENRGLSSELTWNLSDTTYLKSISSYRETYEDQSIDIDSSPATAADPRGLPVVSVERVIFENTAGSPEDLRYRTGDPLKYYTQELRFGYAGSQLDGVAGFYYTHLNEALATGDGGTTASPLLTNNGALLTNTVELARLTNRSYSGFGDLTWHLTKLFDVFGGYRYSHERLTNDLGLRSFRVPNSLFTVAGDTVVVAPGVAPSSILAFNARTDDNQWAGRFGASWHVGPRLSLYGSVSRGFTGAAADTSALATATKAFIAPSTAKSYEVGAKGVFFDQRLRLNVALFKIQVFDLQARYYQTSTSQSIFINTGSFDSQGVEADTTLLVGDRLTLAGSFALTDTKLEGGITQPCYLNQTQAQGCIAAAGGVHEQILDGKPGINVPKVKFNVRSDYDLPLPAMPFDGTAELSYTWQSKESFELLNDPVADFQGSYGTLDFALGVTSRDHRYDVSLFGKNVLDKHFITFGQSEVGRDVRARGFYPRDAFAYFGIKGTYRF